MFVQVPVKCSVRHVHAILPASIAAAIARIAARLGAWIAFDAVLAGFAVGAAVTMVARCWKAPTGASFALGITVGALVVAKVWWARRPDAFTAAATLDHVLDARDRFLSALYFASLSEREEAHALQLAEAEAFLAAHPSVPSPARPALCAHRFVAFGVLVVLASFALRPVLRVVSQWAERRVAFATPPPAPDTPQALAARAAALREALRDAPGRRIDAEINALERALAEQTARTMARRAEAIERAAAAMERARAEELSASTAPSPRELAAVQAVQEATEARARAEATLRALQDEIERASARFDAARAAGDPMAQAEARRQLGALLDRASEARVRRDEALRQEAQAQRALADARREALAPARGVRPEVSLDEAVERLDRALAATAPTDRSSPLPSERTGRALDEASRELGTQLPETARALDEAARARASGDAQRFQEAMERARETLAREARAEPAELRRAREALDRLHDQAAEQAAREAAANAERASRPSAVEREQEALRQGIDPSQQGGRTGSDHGAASDGRDGQLPLQDPRGAQGTQGHPGQQATQGRQGMQGQQGAPTQQGTPGPQGASGQTGMQGGMGRRDPGQGTPGSQGAQGISEAWRAQGMARVPGMPGSGGMDQPSMQAPNGSQGSRGNVTPRTGSVGGDIGDNRGHGYGTGFARGDRTAQVGEAGTQTVSRFERGEGDTDGHGENQMGGRGPGQARGAPGSESGASQGGTGAQRSVGGRSWGAGSGDRLPLGEPGTVGPFGHSVDPGGTPRQPSQIAPDARGVMMPGVAQGGVATGPTSEAPVAPGGLLPDGPGDGALAASTGDDPESAMSTQRVPPSLRAYVRRYFQRIQGGTAVRP